MTGKFLEEGPDSQPVCAKPSAVDSWYLVTCTFQLDYGREVLHRFDDGGDLLPVSTSLISEMGGMCINTDREVRIVEEVSASGCLWKDFGDAGE